MGWINKHSLKQLYVPFVDSLLIFATYVDMSFHVASGGRTATVRPSVHYLAPKLSIMADGSCLFASVGFNSAYSARRLRSGRLQPAALPVEDFVRSAPKPEPPEGQEAVTEVSAAELEWKDGVLVAKQPIAKGEVCACLCAKLNERRPYRPVHHSRPWCLFQAPPS